MTVLDVVSGLLLAAGSLFLLSGGVGLLRFPDFYTRIHAAGVTDTLGAWLILIGLMFQSGMSWNTPKLALVLFFLVCTSPVSSHALAKAAWGRGLRPKLGADLRRGEDA